MDIQVNFVKELLNLNLIKEDEAEEVTKILHDLLDNESSENTLLHYSVRSSNENLTKYLLDDGYDPNIEDFQGTTPLMIAVKNENDAIMKILLAAGADILELNKENRSALHTLSTELTVYHPIIELFFQELRKKCTTSDEIGEKLREAGCPIYIPAIMKDSAVVEYLLKHGCPVNFVHPIHKSTAMHIVCTTEDLKCFNLLLEYGADVNVFNIKNENPLSNLYTKCQKHNLEKIEILKALVDRGVSMTSCTSEGYFQANFTLIFGNREAVKILLEAGLDFNVFDDAFGYNVLHYFAMNFNVGVIQELQFYVDNFDVNALSTSKQPPLTTAVSIGNVQMVKFLLKRNARTDKSDTSYYTPLLHAFDGQIPGYQRRYRDCIELLFEYNADPQIEITMEKGEKFTIFDFVFREKYDDRVELVVSYIALLEKRGTKLTNTTMDKINSHGLSQYYLKNCRQLLNEKISDRVVLFDLLTSDKKKMAIYLNNEIIVQALWKKSSFRSKLRYYPYYCNVLDKRHLNGKCYLKLKNNAIEILCKILQYRYDKTNVIIDKIIDYIDDESLKKLCLV